MNKFSIIVFHITIIVALLLVGIPRGSLAIIGWISYLAFCALMLKFCKWNYSAKNTSVPYEDVSLLN